MLFLYREQVHFVPEITTQAQKGHMQQQQDINIYSYIQHVNLSVSLSACLSCLCDP